ncbi:MAG TPA: hypothetical protein VK524_30945 [Polyangiaceae bacterium]|nr:hypothetical protein [Polyangiaceae bacterium]
MQAPAVSVSVCRRCGVVAPAQGNACDICHQPLSAVRTPAPAMPADQYWVAVRAGFTCNSCRFLAPLDSLDADGAVECAHCGLRQRFDSASWQPALDHAHAVGDLAGPSPEGRNPHPTTWLGSDNPHARVGDTRTFGELSDGALSFHAAPGHPVCQKCSSLLHVGVTGPGSCQSACQSCGDRATFRLSDAARALHEGLIAVVSDDARSDRPKAQLSAPGGGVMTMNCGSCGAPLTLEGKGSLQTCKYCNTSCIVPHRSVSRALHEAIEPAIWWLLLGGVSPKRSELLEEHRGTSGETHLSAIERIKKAAGKKTLGEQPGVYEAPEVKGWNLTQMLFTVVLGMLALLIAFGITRLVTFSF